MKTTLWILLAAATVARGQEAPKAVAEDAFVVYVRNAPKAQAVARSGVEYEDPELWVVKVDGTGAKRLAREKAISAPAMSPDGKSVVVTCSDQVRILGLDGKEDRVLTKEKRKRSEARFAPDGASVVYLSEGQVWSVDAAGKEDKAVADFKEKVASITLSADGKKAATGVRVAGGVEIHVADADGKNDRCIVKAGNHRDVSLSPDGKRVAFTRSEGGSNVTVRSVAVEGGEETRIAEYSEDAVFTADGRVAYVFNPGNAAKGPHFGPNSVIRAADADGKNEKELHASKLSIGWVSFSPDGKRMLFATGGPYMWDLHIADADGSNAKVIAEHSRVGSWGK